MALALGMVHRTMRFESTARTDAKIERTAARLSRQFRVDIHQAESVSLDNRQPDSPFFTLVLPNQSPITYRMESGGLLRHQELEDGQTYREHFLFPEDHTLKFSKLTKPSRAVLTLEHDTQLVGIAPQIKIHVEAVMGHFLQHSQSEEVFP